MRKFLLLFFIFQTLAGQSTSNSPVYTLVTMPNDLGQTQSIYRFPENNVTNLQPIYYFGLMHPSPPGIIKAAKFNPFNSGEMYFTAYMNYQDYTYSQLRILDIVNNTHHSLFIDFDEIISWETFAIHPINGKIYGVSSSNNGLYKIIPDQSPNVNLIRVFDSLIDGLTIDGNGNAYALIDKQLYSLDLDDGSATLIGSLNLPQMVNLKNDIAWDPNTDKIYMTCSLEGGVQQLRLIEKQTGNSTFLGQLNGGQSPGNIYYLSLTFDGSSMNVEDFTSKLLEVYPNPTKEKLYITYKEKIQNLQMFDFSGKKVLEEIGFAQKELNISHLPKGLYLLKVQFKDKTESYRIFKE